MRTQTTEERLEAALKRVDDPNAVSLALREAARDAAKDANAAGALRQQIGLFLALGLSEDWIIRLVKKQRRETARRRKLGDIPYKLAIALQNNIGMEKLPFDITDSRTGEIVIPRRKPINREMIEHLVQVGRNADVGDTLPGAKIMSIIKEYYPR